MTTASRLLLFFVLVWAAPGLAVLHDQFGHPRPDFIRPDDFLFDRPDRVYVGDNFLISVLRYRAPSSKIRERLFWCNLNETRLATRDPNTLSCAKEFKKKPQSLAGTSDLFQLKPGAEVGQGRHLVLATQNDITPFYFAVEVKGRIVPKDLESAGPKMNQAMSRGYLKWCNEGVVAEFAAFNSRPDCGDNDGGPDQAGLSPYQETEGLAVLFKPNILAVETPAYKCVLMETRIGTHLYFFGTRTEWKKVFYKPVAPALCRRWFATKRCSHGPLRKMSGAASLTAYGNWRTNKKDYYYYIWPNYNEYSIFNCLLSEGFVRSQPPYGSLVSSHLGRLPAGYGAGPGAPTHISTGSAVLVWDRFDPDRLCYYKKRMSFAAVKRTYTGQDKPGLVNFISNTTMTTFASRQRSAFNPRGSNRTCLLESARGTTEFYALNQDLVLAFTPGAYTRQRLRRQATFNQAQLTYSYDRLADDLNEVKRNLATNWCRSQQNLYDLNVRGATIDPSAVFSQFYQRPVKAVAHGDLFAIHPCKTIRGSEVTPAASLRTTHNPELYRRLGIAVNEHRCFSRPLVSFSYYNATVWRQVTPQFELSGLFAYTKVCDSAGDYLFEIGDRYYHYRDYELVGSYATADLMDHARRVSCILAGARNGSAGCDASLPDIRFLDAYTRLEQRATEHLEFSDVDPRLYNKTELKSYFSIVDTGTAIAFLQANKEAIYQYRLMLDQRGKNEGKGGFDPNQVYEHVSSSVRETTSGFLSSLGQGIKGVLSQLFDNPVFQGFLIICSIGGTVQLVRLVFLALRLSVAGKGRGRGAAGPLPPPLRNPKAPAKGAEANRGRKRTRRPLWRSGRGEGSQAGPFG